MTILEQRKFIFKILEASTKIAESSQEGAANYLYLTKENYDNMIKLYPDKCIAGIKFELSNDIVNEVGRKSERGIWKENI